jgi:hypothetical protein
MAFVGKTCGLSSEKKVTVLAVNWRKNAVTMIKGIGSVNPEGVCQTPGS